MVRTIKILHHMILASKIFPVGMSVKSFSISVFQSANTLVRVEILSIWQNFNMHLRICVLSGMTIDYV